MCIDWQAKYASQTTTPYCTEGFNARISEIPEDTTKQTITGRICQFEFKKIISFAELHSTLFIWPAIILHRCIISVSSLRLLEIMWPSPPPRWGHSFTYSIVLPFISNCGFDPILCSHKLSDVNGSSEIRDGLQADIQVLPV